MELQIVESKETIIIIKQYNHEEKSFVPKYAVKFWFIYGKMAIIHSRMDQSRDLIIERSPFSQKI